MIDKPSQDNNDIWLDESVQQANLPTLACLLVHLTGERRWIEGDYKPTRSRGMDDNDDGGLSPEIQGEIRRQAVLEIKAWRKNGSVALANPSDELLVEMMSVALGEEIPARYGAMIRSELELDARVENPVDPSAEIIPSGPVPEGFCAVIIGAGISGLCAAARLAEAGIAYVILERNSGLGGVWRENKYPGAACDVPSHLYSFSFAQYNWSEYFAGSDEIETYLNFVADSCNIRPFIHFQQDVSDASFDEATNQWTVSATNSAGKTQQFSADMVVSGVGAFNKPKYPNVTGLVSFAGDSVHTARWPKKGVELAGRNVVVVGNGASAMQVVPAIADQVKSLTVIQRAPQWAAPFPKFKKKVPAAVQSLIEAVPLYRLWYRLRLSWAFNDKLYDALQVDTNWAHPDRSINAINDKHRAGLTSYIESELGDRQDLLPDLIPDYPPFGKRLLMDNGWARTLTKDNVSLVNGSVNKVHKDGLELTDGTQIEADVIIWATGFDVVNFLAPMAISGIDNHQLHDDWDGDDARAYLGTLVPNYPNFFCLYGPNTQFGHGGSLISIIERQVSYVMSLLGKMFANDLRCVDVREDVYERYNAEVDAKHEGMIWTHQGMSTYYRNSKGRVVVCNPFRIVEFWEMTASADLNDYRAVAKTSDKKYQSSQSGVKV